MIASDFVLNALRLAPTDGVGGVPILVAIS